MKIGVLSDTHGRLEITQSAMRLLRERGAELILHCGDIDSPGDGTPVQQKSQLISYSAIGTCGRPPLKRAIR